MIKIIIKVQLAKTNLWVGSLDRVELNPSQVDSQVESMSTCVLVKSRFIDIIFVKLSHIRHSWVEPCVSKSNWTHKRLSQFELT